MKVGQIASTKGMKLRLLKARSPSASVCLWLLRGAIEILEYNTIQYNTRLEGLGERCKLPSGIWGTGVAQNPIYGYEIHVGSINIHTYICIYAYTCIYTNIYIRGLPIYRQGVYIGRYLTYRPCRYIGLLICSDFFPADISIGSGKPRIHYRLQCTGRRWIGPMDFLQLAVRLGLVYIWLYVGGRFGFTPGKWITSVSIETT